MELFRGISPFSRALIILLIIILFFIVKSKAEAQGFRDKNLSVDNRIARLLADLTLEEKISLLGYNSPGVARLGILRYNWWNESLHGIARAGNSTVFPQAIGMAATFNDSLVNEIAKVISTEARAKYNLAVKRNSRLQYMGLTFWSPNINLFRDPRWGRGQETYGEDPFLTSRMGVAYIKGMQGSDNRYLKTSACAKHFAVHSGPEASRHIFNAVVDEKDLRETYLFAFKALVDNGVESIMCGYNRLNGEPCCTGPTLLQNILREEWKFKGHVVTDCWALEDIWARHKVLKNSVEVAAAAIKAGINVDCSNLLQDDVKNALGLGLITTGDIDKALTPSLRTQFKLGFFDAVEENPYHSLGIESVHAEQHVALSRKAAQQSMVLLKNKNGLLPLREEQYQTMLIAGPNASSLDPLLANYHGVSENMVTFVEGITAAVPVTMGIQYDQGCDYSDTTRFGGIWASDNSDVTIAVIGLTPVLEGEEGDAFLAASGGDKQNLDLPAAHIAYLKAIRKKHNKPLIAVVTAGSAVDLSAIDPYVDAIILAWYPGEQGGHALADVLFGKVSPSGRLPITFYKSFDDLPAYDNYSLLGRTYRYYSGKVQYPFGFGLSYSTFEYYWKTPPLKKYSSKDTIQFSVLIKNVGSIDADETVQVYVQYPNVERMPLKELKAFCKKSIEKNGDQEMKFSIAVDELKKWDLKKNSWRIYPGEYRIMISHDSEDHKLFSSFQIK